MRPTATPRRASGRATAAAVVVALGMAACTSTEPVTNEVAEPRPTTTVTASPAPEATGPAPASSPAATESPAAAQTPAPEPLAVFRRHDVTDPMVNGQRAYSLYVPEGWSVSGGIEWRPAHFPLAGAVVDITDPSGSIGIQSMFPSSFAWSDGGPQLIPEGELWLGSLVFAPRSAADAITTLALPRHRPDAQVVEVAPIDTSMHAGEVDGARVRIRWQGPDGPVEEDVYGVTSYLSASAGGSTITNWGFEYLHAVRAPVGQLDAAMPVLSTILSSIELDLDWFAEYATVVQLFIDNNRQAIANAAELSRIISQNNAEINQIIMDTYTNNQRVYDEIHQRRVEQISETQRVVPPEGGTITTPAGTPCDLGDGTIVILQSSVVCPQGSTPLQVVN